VPTGTVKASVGDPDPHVLGHPDPDPLVRCMDPDPRHTGVERTEVMLQNKIVTQNFRQKIYF
jgi:hypothetical protein